LDTLRPKIGVEVAEASFAADLLDYDIAVDAIDAELLDSSHGQRAVEAFQHSRRSRRNSQAQFSRCIFDSKGITLLAYGRSLPCCHKLNAMLSPCLDCEWTLAPGHRDTRRLGSRIDLRVHI
jgi:hypothetical protein